MDQEKNFVEVISEFNDSASCSINHSIPCDVIYEDEINSNSNKIEDLYSDTCKNFDHSTLDGLSHTADNGRCKLTDHGEIHDCPSQILDQVHPVSATNLSGKSCLVNSFTIHPDQIDLGDQKTTSSQDDLNNNRPNRKKGFNNFDRFVSFTPSDNDQYHDSDGSLDESPYKALRQLIIPCLIAGCGSVAAGIVLAIVQQWEVFQNIPQLNILVPALMGLKDNVAMTLASRLSTLANLKSLDHSSEKIRIMTANMALAQCQASTIGLFTPFIAVAITYISPAERYNLTVGDIVFLITVSVATSNIANFVLNSMVCCLVSICHRFKIDPDNIATPLAASFGDLITMLSIAFFSRCLFLIKHLPEVHIGITIGILSLIPFSAFMATKQKSTRKVLMAGWFPICGSMLIQIMGGFVMENSLSNFTKLAVFQPLMTGIGGNLASIQTSRNSTYFLRQVWQDNRSKNDLEHFKKRKNFSNRKASSHSYLAPWLILFSIPAHILFVLIIKIAYNHFTLTTTFFTCYLSAAAVQATVLMQISYSLVRLLWKMGLNPDNSALPILTATGDMIGSLVLMIAFIVMRFFKDVNAES